MEATLEPIVDQIRSGELDAARSAIESAGSSGANSADLQFLRGFLEESAFQPEEALICYERVLEEAPDHAEATFHAAVLYDQTGEDEKAIELYRNCIETPPIPVSALLNLAVLYEEDRRYDEAMALVQSVLNEFPNHSRATQLHKSVEASAIMVQDDSTSRDREGRHAILDQPISEFELSVRSRNCLRQMSIRTLGDLLRTTEAELMSYRNFGETSLCEIKAMLANRGFQMGQAALSPVPAATTEPRLPVHIPVTESDVGMQAGRSIADLELSVRSRKALQRLGVSTIGELVSRSEPELMTVKNFGLTSLTEIKQQLAKAGFSLRTSP